MAPETTITSLRVQGVTMVAQFSSSNPTATFEIMLNGWSKWRPAESPVTLSGLSPGLRTFSVRSIGPRGADKTPATRSFTIASETDPTPEPEPEPEPEPPDLPLLWTGDKTSDWDDELTEAGSITDTSQGIKIAIPGPSSASYRRCELASYSTERGGSPIPGDRVYEWEFMVPGRVNLSTKAGDDNNHINQTKSNNAAGYTGGVDIRPNGQVLYVVSPDSENHEFVFGAWRPDTYHRVRLNVSWRKDATGTFTASLDGKAGSSSRIKNAPSVADKMYFRLGWYPADVPSPGLEMYLRGVKVYGR